jgi:glycosyltransferase involved in cell wall biosynthesis
VISVFTPSHNSKYLDDAYESLKAQTYKGWEWIVLLNGDAEWNRPNYDDRVRIAYADAEINGNVGALKRHAADLCSGDILVELDHDDILAPNALSKIKEVFDKNSQTVFVYSDFSQINEDKTPNLEMFDLTYGWSYYQDGEHLVCSSLEHTPHNVSYIWYAPNHVRAFRKSAYNAAGGYDSSRKVLDDQDLINRLYLQGRFYHIKECLYYQRIHLNNTQIEPETNRFIQEETVKLHAQNIQPLLLKWSEDNGLLALDLGGAHNPAPGYKTVDLYEPADYVGDVFNIFGKMEDNSVGVIRAVDFCEHISDKIRLWNEFYRVLAHGGMVLSLTPSTDGRGAFQDPTHVAFYNQNSFWYWVDENYRRYVPEIKANFQISQLFTHFPSNWHQENNIPYVCANLIAIKDGPRQGGRLGI